MGWLEQDWGRLGAMVWGGATEEVDTTTTGWCHCDRPDTTTAARSSRRRAASLLSRHAGVGTQDEANPNKSIPVLSFWVFQHKSEIG